MNELFEIPVCKSPRLQWMEKQEVLTHYCKDEAPGQEWMCIQPFIEDEGKDLFECMADNCRIYEETNRIGYGRTEEEAITDWAVKTKTPLWNEEQP